MCRGSATDAMPIVPPANHGRSQASQRVVAGDERADAGRVAEGLVPGHRHEVGLPARQVEAVRRDECRGVEEDVKATLLGRRDPLERVAHAGIVRLGGKREQVSRSGRGVVEGGDDSRRVVTEVARAQRDVGDGRAPGAGELADAVDRVVVVGRQDEPAPVGERERLADELRRSAGVRGEDDRVLVGRGADEGQDRRPGAVGKIRGGPRRRVLGVGVAQDPVSEQREMLADLRLGVEARAGVVDVDLAGAVEAAVLAGPKRREHVDAGRRTAGARAGRWAWLDPGGHDRHRARGTGPGLQLLFHVANPREAVHCRPHPSVRRRGVVRIRPPDAAGPLRTQLWRK